MDLIEYIFLILPGFILLMLTYFLLPYRSIAFRIFLLVTGFILLRDAMTPIGFWKLGNSDGIVWMRFIEDPAILFILSGTSLLLTLAIIWMNPRLKAYIIWFGRSKISSLFIGIIGAVIVTGPFLILYGFVPIEARGGIVNPNILIPLFTLALFGNFMEEVLFRGYIQGYFEQMTGRWRAAILSGFLFALGHIFLATTVTDLGMIVLLFTLYEGIVCAIVRMNHGVIASTVTHGLAIFVLSSGFF